MGVDRGCWFDNQKEVDARIQNLDSDGNLSGTVNGTLAGKVVLESTVVYGPSSTEITSGTGIAVLNAGTGAVDVSISSGSQSYGQIMLVVCEDATNACTVTHNFFGATGTITFNAVGSSVLLANVLGVSESGWAIIGSNGVTLS